MSLVNTSSEHTDLCQIVTEMRLQLINNKYLLHTSSMLNTIQSLLLSQRRDPKTLESKALRHILICNPCTGGER